MTCRTKANDVSSENVVHLAELRRSKSTDRHIVEDVDDFLEEDLRIERQEFTLREGRSNLLKRLPYAACSAGLLTMFYFAVRMY